MALKITFINHATLLVQMDGINILTDPIYSRTVSFMFPRRQKPGILFEDLPPIDYIVISHSDYDHMNLKTLRMLRRRRQSTLVLPEGWFVTLRRPDSRRSSSSTHGNRQKNPISLSRARPPNIIASARRGIAQAPRAVVLFFNLRTIRSISPEIRGMLISFKSLVLVSRLMRHSFLSVPTSPRSGLKICISTLQQRSRHSLTSKRDTLFHITGAHFGSATNRWLSPPSFCWQNQSVFSSVTKSTS